MALAGPCEDYCLARSAIEKSVVGVVLGGAYEQGRVWCGCSVGNFSGELFGVLSRVLSRTLSRVLSGVRYSGAI